MRNDSILGIGSEPPWDGGSRRSRRGSVACANLLGLTEANVKIVAYIKTLWFSVLIAGGERVAIVA